MGIKDWSGDLKDKVHDTYESIKKDPKGAIKKGVKKGAIAKVFAVPVLSSAEQKYLHTNVVQTLDDGADAIIEGVVDAAWYGGESMINSNISTYNWVKEQINESEHIDPGSLHDVARVGSRVSCPIHGEGVVVAGINTTLVLGQPLAMYGDVTSCGARLLPPCRPFVVNGRYVACVGDPTSHGGRILTGVPSIKVY